MGVSRGLAAARQNKFFQTRQGFIELLDQVFQPRHCLGWKHIETRHAQGCAQIKQVVLNAGEFGGQALRQGFSQYQADVAVQLIDIAHGMNTKIVFRQTAAIGQASGAIVASAGGD